MADEDVLGDAQIGKDHRLLIDGDDPPALGIGRRTELGRLAVDADRTLVRLVDPRHRLDQRRLAGAVLTDQGMHLAGEQRDSGAVEGPGRPEALVDAIELHHGGRIGDARCLTR